MSTAQQYKGLAANLKRLAEDLAELDRVREENARLKETLREIGGHPSGSLDAMVAWEMKHAALGALEQAGDHL